MRTDPVRFLVRVGGVTDPTARALSLLALLQVRADWTAAQLAGRLAVTPRTVRRDMDRLRSLGYPVEASPGRSGGYRLGAGRNLPPLLLDDEEATAVALALRVATGSGDRLGPTQEAAVRAMVKLEAVLPPAARARVRAVRETTTTLLRTSSGVPADVVAELGSAIHQRVLVRFGYAARDGARSERRAEPHRLVTTGPRWYLMAYDLDRAAWRSFRVDRMSQLHVTTFRFRARPAPDPATYIQESISTAPYSLTIRVRVHQDIETLRQRIGATARLTPVAPNRTVLEAGVDDLDLAARWLAGQGWSFDVLDPPELAGCLTELASRLLRIASSPQ